MANVSAVLVVVLTITLCHHISVVDGQTGVEADGQVDVQSGADGVVDITNQVGAIDGQGGTRRLFGIVGGRDSKPTTTPEPCLPTMASCSWHSECCSNMCKLNHNAGYRCM